MIAANCTSLCIFVSYSKGSAVQRFTLVQQCRVCTTMEGMKVLYVTRSVMSRSLFSFLLPRDRGEWRIENKHRTKKRNHFWNLVTHKLGDSRLGEIFNLEVLRRYEHIIMSKAGVTTRALQNSTVYVDTYCTYSMIQYVDTKYTCCSNNCNTTLYPFHNMWHDRLGLQDSQKHIILSYQNIMYSTKHNLLSYQSSTLCYCIWYSSWLVDSGISWHFIKNPLQYNIQGRKQCNCDHCPPLHGLVFLKIRWSPLFWSQIGSEIVDLG